MINVSPEMNKICRGEEVYTVYQVRGKRRGGGKAHIPKSEQRAIEEKHNTQEHEQGAKRRQCDPNFCRRRLCMAW
jgi:hypothetical protein